MENKCIWSWWILNEYGVCPFDTRNALKDNPYAGTHRIQWNDIEVPVDGNYNIEVAVDDTVDLSIIESQRATGGTGGDPVVIQKKGFKGDSSKGTGVSSYTRFLRKGKHKIMLTCIKNLVVDSPLTLLPQPRKQPLVLVSEEMVMDMKWLLMDLERQILIFIESR